MGCIGFIVPTEEFKRKVLNYMDIVNFDSELIVEVLDCDNIIPQAVEMVYKGANAIVARGGTYHVLSEALDVPVIKFSITTEDILSALYRASLYTNTAYLIIEEVVSFDYDEWKDLLNIEVNLFKIKSIDEIKDMVYNIKQIDENAVIVGGVITVECAKEFNLQGVFIDNKETSFLQTFLQVEKLLMDALEDLKRMKVLELILQNIDDAVIVLSENGIIEHFNKCAEGIFGREKESVIGHKVNEILPELGSNQSRFDKEMESINTINGKTVTISMSPLEMQNRRIGMVCTIQDITEIQSLERKLRVKLNKKGLTAKYRFDDMIAIEESMKSLITKARRASLAECTILIYGESGTGKELLSQSIHNESTRNKGPFVAVNCAALSESLLESELFGYEEGAFTGARKGGKAGLFELAHGGTIFLDEINSISVNLQTKLLRVLEEKELMKIGSDYVIPLDVRVIAATNENLIEQVLNNQFRRDLFFRLNVIELSIPPLRERKNEIVFLFCMFLSNIIKKTVNQIDLSPDLIDRLLSHPWWGNVRELKNVAERYSVFGDVIDIEDLFSFSSTQPVLIEDDFSLNINEISNTVESLIIETLLNQGRSKVDVANILGISRTALYKKMKKNDV